MLFGAPTTWPAVFDAIEAQVLTTGVVDASRIFLVINDDIVAFSTDKPDKMFITYSAPSGKYDQSEFAGGARRTVVVDALLQLTFWTNYNVDQPLRDTARVKDDTNGIMRGYKAVRDALHNFKPVGSDGKCILIDPLSIDSFKIVPQPKNDLDAHVRLMQWYRVKFRELMG